MRENILRYFAFTAGLYLLAFAISLIVTAALGVTPISSINYVLSLNTPLSLGSATVALNVVLIVLQLWLLRGGVGTRKDYVEIMLQIPFSLLFGVFIDINMSCLAGVHVENYLWQLGLLLAGCLVQATAVVIEVRSNVVIMSAEGFVKYASRRYGCEFGKIKVAFDVTLVAVATALSLAFTGGVDGVREGTVIAAVLTGVLVSLVSKRVFTPLHLSRFL